MLKALRGELLTVSRTDLSHPSQHLEASLDIIFMIICCYCCVNYISIQFNSKALDSVRKICTCHIYRLNWFKVVNSVPNMENFCGIKWLKWGKFHMIGPRFPMKKIPHFTPFYPILCH